jgi:phosphoribosylformylglycinamidine cyclo-ligase
MKTYKDSGVDIHEGYKSVNLIKEHAKRTHSKNVLNDIGSFASMYEIANFKNPVLVSGTDGVGTKLEIAMKLNKYDTVGIDCVAMCVNDILCHGAKPLFFLDYIACGKLESEKASDIVKGISDGCIQSNCSLIGGETAEMPGFYDIGKYDIAGFAVGIVEKENVIDGSEIKENDVLIGIQSSGVHSNGFSLIRALIKDLNEKFEDKTIGETLLTPTKIYINLIQSLMKNYKIKGMSHITGGGFYENIPRMFKTDFTAEIYKNSYEIPKIFKHIMSLGVPEDEMYNTFNMGIGFIICVNEKDSENILKEIEELGEKAYKIGIVKAGERKVCLK